jgi:transposase
MMLGSYEANCSFISNPRHGNQARELREVQSGASVMARFGIPVWQTSSPKAFGQCCSDIIGSHFECTWVHARHEKGKSAPVTPDDFFCLSVRKWGVLTLTLCALVTTSDSFRASCWNDLVLTCRASEGSHMTTVLRSDFNSRSVRYFAAKSNDPAQGRRLLALAEIYDGASRGEAAAVGGVTRQAVRDWSVRFNREGPQGLTARKRPGRPPSLDKGHRAALAIVVESGPMPYLVPGLTWRMGDLCQWLFDERGVQVSRRSLSRTLRQMGIRRLVSDGQRPSGGSELIQAVMSMSRSAWKASR